LIDSILPKWNPTAPNLDFCEELALTDKELECNKKPIETDARMFFDPNFSVSTLENGFRIFAFEDSLNKILARRYKLTGPDPSLMTVFLYAYIVRPGEFDPTVKVMIKTEITAIS
jgi:hypothetical protein